MQKNGEFNAKPFSVAKETGRCGNVEVRLQSMKYKNNEYLRGSCLSFNVWKEYKGLLNRDVETFILILIELFLK